MQQAPELPDSIKQFWSRLAKAKTVTYTARVWQPQFEKEGVPITVYNLKDTFEVTAQRPNKLRIT